MSAKRQQIMDQIYAALVAMKSDRTYGVSWKTMAKLPLSSIRDVRTPAVSLVDFQEVIIWDRTKTGTKRALNEDYVKTCDLKFKIEFWNSLTPSEVAAEELNDLLVRIQRAVDNTAPTLDSNAVSIWELGSEFSLTEGIVRTMGGTLIYRVRYFRQHQDPEV